jgi:hypothetical protein
MQERHGTLLTSGHVRLRTPTCDSQVQSGRPVILSVNVPVGRPGQARPQISASRPKPRPTVAEMDPAGPHRLPQVHHARGMGLTPPSAPATASKPNTPWHASPCRPSSPPPAFSSPGRSRTGCSRSSSPLSPPPPPPCPRPLAPSASRRFFTEARAAARCPAAWPPPPPPSHTPPRRRPPSAREERAPLPRGGSPWRSYLGTIHSSASCPATRDPTPSRGRSGLPPPLSLAAGFLQARSISCSFLPSFLVFFVCLASS